MATAFLTSLQLTQTLDLIDWMESSGDIPAGIGKVVSKVLIKSQDVESKIDDLEISLLAHLAAKLGQPDVRDRYTEAGPVAWAINQAFNPAMNSFEGPVKMLVRQARRFLGQTPAFPVMNSKAEDAYAGALKEVHSSYSVDRASRFLAQLPKVPAELRLDLVWNFLKSENWNVATNGIPSQIIEGAAPLLTQGECGRLATYMRRGRDYTVRHKGHAFDSSIKALGKLLPFLDYDDLIVSMEWLTGLLDTGPAPATVVADNLDLLNTLDRYLVKKSLFRELQVSPENNLDTIISLAERGVEVPWLSYLAGSIFCSHPWIFTGNFRRLANAGLLNDQTLLKNICFCFVSSNLFPGDKKRIHFWSQAGLDSNHVTSSHFWTALDPLFRSLNSDMIKGFTDCMMSCNPKPTPAEIAGLIMGLSTLLGKEFDDLAEEVESWEKHAAETQNIFNETAIALGINKVFLRDYPLNTLVSWHVDGLPSIWQGYVEELDDPQSPAYQKALGELVKKTVAQKYEKELVAESDPKKRGMLREQLIKAEWATIKIPAEIRDQVRQDLAKKMTNFLGAQLRVPAPSMAALLIRRALQISEAKFLEMLRQNLTADEKATLARLMKTPVWGRFKASRLYGLLIKASQFMEQAGIQSMQKLVLGLRLEGKQLVYPRYEELQGVFGPELLKKWAQDYRADFEATTTAAEDVEGSRQILIQQTVHQNEDDLKEISSPASDPPLDLKDLPEQVRAWNLNPEPAQARKLFDIFERHYKEIRAAFGDSFANIRTNLKNLLHGLSKGIIIAKKSEAFVVSGDIETLARSGSEPVFTCQTLEYEWVNAEGQPLNRLIHGQFKVANWEVDGRVVARRLIEITVDPTGNEHLLIERLYTAGGLTKIKEFRNQIVAYAHFLGIKEGNVHFSNEGTLQTAPGGLNTGDEIYRDTFKTASFTHEAVKKYRAAGLKSEMPGILGVEFINEYGMLVAKYETLDDFREEHVPLLQQAGVAMIRVLGGNPWGADYFQRKPVKLAWSMPVPSSEKNHLAQFNSRDRSSFKRKLSKSARLTIDSGKLTADDYAAWHAIYLKEIGERPRGRVVIDGNWFHELNGREKNRRKLFVRDADGKLLGGAILNVIDGVLTIGFMTTLAEHRDKQVATRLVFETMKVARELGIQKISYGIDHNLYGHHLDIGLLQWKLSFGFKPRGYGGTESIRILDAGAFLPNIFYLTDDNQACLHEGHTLSQSEIESLQKDLGLKIRLVKKAQSSAVPRKTPSTPGHVMLPTSPVRRPATFLHSSTMSARSPISASAQPQPALMRMHASPLSHRKNNLPLFRSAGFFVGRVNASPLAPMRLQIR